MKQTLFDTSAEPNPIKLGQIKQPQATLDQRVHNMDCREGLDTLKDNSVSVVITDPPYFIDGMGDDWDDTSLNKKVAKSGVIGGLPVGMKFDSNQSKQLLQFLEPVARQWMRVTKPGGFVLCFMQPRLAHAATMAMENAGIEIRDVLTWQRSGQAKAFSQDHFVKKRKDLTSDEKQHILDDLDGRKTPQLRPLGESIILGQVPKEGTFVDNWMKWGVGLIDTKNPFIDTDMFPATIMSVPRPRERHGHLTAKPVDLLRHLIRIFGGKTPVVLDTFSGCGSTGEACVRENCQFIGFEIEQLYATIANNRIRTARCR
ncbi:MAG: site-specific DNA-methyltransferase [Proteobacteria bacterium]|nr:site-specific DNA-methyltransferase [Pseudomonadota bacterium]